MRRLAALVAVVMSAGLAVLGFAGAASAHTHNVQVSCGGVKVALSGYNANVVNTVAVWIDSPPTPAHSFGSTTTASAQNPNTQVAHTYTVVVKAGDDPTGSRGYSFTQAGTIAACPAITVALSPPTVEVPTTWLSTIPATTQIPATSTTSAVTSSSTAPTTAPSAATSTTPPTTASSTSSSTPATSPSVPSSSTPTATSSAPTTTAVTTPDAVATPTLASSTRPGCTITTEVTPVSSALIHCTVDNSPSSEPPTTSTDPQPPLPPILPATGSSVKVPLIVGALLVIVGLFIIARIPKVKP